ncbi:MAG TPA: isochorismate synthase [Thermoanaerobaculia bacterium]|nr:isochorismate synthase [Thermoanaerobaculia bacterium]
MSVARSPGESSAEDTLHRLARLLETGRRQCASSPAGELARFVVSAPDLEPRAVLRVPAGKVSLLPAGESFLWEPPDGAQLGGLGRAALLSGSGEERLRQVREAAERVSSRLVVFAEPGIEAPPALFVGGGAFRPEGAVRARWAGFGDASFVLPRWLVRRAPGEPAALELTLGAAELVAADLDDLLGEADSLLDSTPFSLGCGALAPIEASWEEPAAEEERWYAATRGILDAIRRGDLRKAVAARWLDVRLPSSELAPARAGADLPANGALPADGVVERVVDAFERGCSECVRFVVQRGGHAFLGATPELLVEQHGLELRTHALAGTERNDPEPEEQARRARSVESGCDLDGGAAERLLARDKDRREHQLVVEHIVDRLAPYCAELEAPSEPRVRSLRHLLHLETPIEGRLSEPRHVLELAAALHPTPAVAGVPVDRSLALLAALEAGERGWYAGPVGWFDERGDGALSVALRSMLVGRSSARLFAGAGIVADSQPQAELEETRWKLAGAWTALTAAVGGELEIERGAARVAAGDDWQAPRPSRD